MVVGLDLNLSFRRTDLLRDPGETHHLFDQRRDIRPKERRSRATAPDGRYNNALSKAPLKRDPARVMKMPRHRISAFPSWRETKVSYRCVERGRSIHLFCLLHAQIGSVFSTMILRC